MYRARNEYNSCSCRKRVINWSEKLTSNSSRNEHGSANIGGQGYLIGVSMGIVVLIGVMALASYFCTRVRFIPTTPVLPVHRLPLTNLNALDQSQGLDEATIVSYPKHVFSECCSICLADYKDVDVVRVLPDCGHMFHQNCIDPWLRMHPTCPLCRTSPLPSPLSTPLAEVLPFAADNNQHS